MDNKECYFCSETDRLQQHHIVPRRFDGSDDSENLVTVCPTCHDKLEDLYDKRFYDELGVEKNTGPEPEECMLNECSATTTNRVPEAVGGTEMPLCERHTKNCDRMGCERVASSIVRYYEDDRKFVSVCEHHTTCAYGDCANSNVRIWDEYGGKPLCFEHIENYIDG